MSGLSLFGVNISGAEYGSGGAEGTNYTYPTDAEIDYFASKGFTAIRLPFLLERVQPVMDGPLSATELGYIDNVVNYAASKGIDVILDPHDYGDAYGSQIGSAAVPNSAFANFWGQLAGHFASNSNVLFGLMNEPHDISATQWLGSVNAAISAIRASGATSQQILVPGTYWDSADTWTSSDNATVIGNGVVDPSHNFAFEVHQYLDTWGSGTQSDVVSATIGAQRLAAVTAWAEATGNKLFLGEFGVSSDAVSLEALNNMLSFMQQHSDVWEGGTYWAAGAWQGTYMYSVEPANGVDKPQMAILDQYASATPSNGSASVAEVGNNFYVNSVSGGPGVELNYAGAAVVAGQFGAMTPIAAIQTATGYEVAWKVTGADQYEVWTTDNSGDHVSDTGIISGTSNVLEALETSFHEDLNGDGVIGFSTTVINAVGSTSLVEVGSNFYLYSTASGPSLKYSGVAVVAGQFGAMAPIAAEQTATGYEVAWKVAGADQYSVWNTDSDGNYISSIVSLVSGSSPVFESLETTFQQDLNGDGIIGLPANTTAIEMLGSTSLMEVRTNFYLDSNNSGSGPELKHGGAAVVAGQFGAWAPIGVEQTATGFEVAWKVTGADQYSVWNADSSGNYLGSTAVLSGASATSESYETSFHQDLNGDGRIGPPITVIEASGSTSLVEVGNHFYLNSISSGSGPELTSGGAAVVAGQFGAWTPIGVEQTATGFEVAWKATGADQYSVWNTDSSGNYLGSTAVLSGASATLGSYETSFHQDLNGDGTIGPPITVIEASGSTSLVEVSNHFYLNSISSGSGPELTSGGAAVVAGQFGVWTPIGVEQTATGFEVAWKATGADQYSVWNTDSSGNYLGSTAVLSGASATLESYETSFHQDLNGDGTIGVAVHAGATVELATADSGSVTFVSPTGTLKLDAPSSFSGEIFGFTGDGTLAGSDQIDLGNLTYNNAIQSQSTYNSSTGLLAVNNGTSTVDLNFFGSYSEANFKFASDGHGGTIVYDPPVVPSGAKDAAIHIPGSNTINDTSSQPIVERGATPTPAADVAIKGSTITDHGTADISHNSTVNILTGANQDSFFFKPNFVQGTITPLTPETGTIQINPAVSASMESLLAVIHDDSHSNPVITDATHAAQLLAHQVDHFFV
jgi:aryl-phospho-beta-D-glucosidase BglC (GH1 family)/20S proteasome alpha/beta subunit